MRLTVLLSFVSVLVLLTSPAQAYVGPGLGLGALGAAAGVLFALFVALFALVWMPVKRLINRRRQMTGTQNDAE